MRFTYCPHCGEKLTEKVIGDEGLIPYCDTCRVPLWDMVTTCVICAVVNEEREIALIRQSYGNQTNYVCVAGVMTIGESAEDAAKREIAEEIAAAVNAEVVQVVGRTFVLFRQREKDSQIRLPK